MYSEIRCHVLTKSTKCEISVLTHYLCTKQDTMNTQHIENYLALRNEIDTQTEALWNQHQSNMACKKGCDQCCLNFDVFPIEFEAIKQQVQAEYPEVLERSVPDEETEKCVFLTNHQCSFYDARPIICRTHGFPLLYMNEEGDQWELSHCELNFTQVDEDYFDEANTYPQDTINSKLFMMNKAYINSLDHAKHNEFDLIPLANLLKK